MMCSAVGTMLSAGHQGLARPSSFGASPELAVELMGKPTFRTGDEWRWGRKGSLSVVIAGARAGMWFDHEAGEGGGLQRAGAGRPRG